MKTRKTYAQILGIAAIAVLSVSAWTGEVRADCPDYVSCSIPMPSHGSKEVGRINVSTCYKFGHGCRPWHCNDAPKTDRDHWLKLCRKNFPKCAENNYCKASFPGAPNQ